MEDYIQSHSGHESELVILENIALFENLRDPSAGSDPSNIIMSLVNIQEELALKNNPAFRVKKLSGEVVYKNAPVFLNLYLLVSANHPTYSDAVKNLSLIIQFFQGKNGFTISNSYNPFRETDNALDFDDEEAIRFSLKIDLLSLTFEQVNHLWGSLGGKQVPFVLYKVRMVEVEDNLKQGGGGIIKETVILSNSD